MSIGSWTPKTPTEVDVFSIDLAGNLAAGETLLPPTCVVSVVDGVDASPASMLSGGASASGTVVRQTLIGGVATTTYKVQFTVVTSLGRTLVTCASLRVELC